MRKISDRNAINPKIEDGITKIAAIVKRTLGPGGLTILLEREGVSPTGEPLGPMMTKDGVTVANDCADPDPEVNLVIQAVKAICRKTNKVAGDGTTTAIVLGEAILKECMAMLDANPELNPQLIRSEVEKASRQALEELKALAKPVKDLTDIEEVAAISANGDRQVASVIRKAFEAVGAEGVITVDEGHGADTTIDIVDGFQVRSGAEAQDRFFNNSDLTKFEAENAKVLVFDGKVQRFTDILAPLNKLAEKAQTKMPPVIIIANEFNLEVITWMLYQKAELGIQFCAVKSPHTTSVRTSMLEDIAIALGGFKFGNGTRSLETAKYEDFGTAGKVVVDKYTTTFYDGGTLEEREQLEQKVIARVEQLKAQRKLAESPYDASVISDRISMLSQGVAKIGVGGSTDLEIKERYHRIEDALNAARAAVEEGIVPGGGRALMLVADRLDPECIGTSILWKAFQSPFQQILENVGKTPEKMVEIAEQIESVNEHATYDAMNDRIVDAFEAGIIDPVKVTRTALENAVSISALLTTCGGAITVQRPK